jgi:monovalent cation/proton antiporter MnhG/PhaG subunit
MNLAEVLIGVTVLLGAAIMLLGAIGMIRFGDVYLRMHAGTKASTLGIGLVMTAVAFYFADGVLTIKLIALGVLYFFTAPTGAQLLARSAHQARTPMVQETWIDELTEN